MDAQQTAVDLLAFADESGERGFIRDLTPSRDDLISVLCSLPIPMEHLDAVREYLEPLFNRFKAAAPTGAKLHIAEAFKQGNESWRVVAEQVRQELFSTMHGMRIVVIYVARRCRLARETYEKQETMLADALAQKQSKIKIVGSNRPNDERIEDNLMIGLALMLDTFAEQEGRKKVDVMFDQVDIEIAKRYEEALEITRNVSRNQTTVRGWDPDAKATVSGSIAISVDAPFSLDSRFLGKISVVGKDDPLIFAVDVVANSLWRHLSTLPPASKLNDGPSVASWALSDLVWAKDHEKNFDLF